jgi:hypothetical protein
MGVRSFRLWNTLWARKHWGQAGIANRQYTLWMHGPAYLPVWQHTFSACANWARHWTWRGMT